MVFILYQVMVWTIARLSISKLCLLKRPDSRDKIFITKSSESALYDPCGAQ